MDLEHALRAGIPLVHVSGTDPIFLPKILRTIAPKTKQIREFQPRAGRADHTIYYSVDPVKFDSNRAWAVLYADLEQKESIVILTQGEQEESPLVFDAGIAPVPLEVLAEILLHWKIDDPKIGRALIGLPLPEVIALLRLASVGAGITVKHLKRLREDRKPLVTGIETVHTALGHYWPHHGLKQWIDQHRIFFRHPRRFDRELIPRGLLFEGPPGTGKTLGAKYVAARLGVPLYRYDIGSILSKWVGGSEENMRRALASIEQAGSAVLLIDESEKMFSERTDDHHTQRNLLGQLLWWLQEHQAPVLTIMTSNHSERIPPELIRPGRLDGVIRFPLLSPKGQLRLYRILVGSYPIEERPTAEAIGLPVGTPLSHAAVAQRVILGLRRQALSPREKPRKQALGGGGG